MDINPDLNLGIDRRSFAFGFIAALAIVSIPSFLDHYIFFISGQVKPAVIGGRWDIVALNVVGFLVFLIPLAYRRKADWKSMGVYAAFIVSLFVEMYGIPLTVYLSSAALASPGGENAPNYLIEFTFLGQFFGMDFWTIVGAIITFIGMVIVAVGWYTIYRAVQEDELVTSGIYRYSRHPQYVGIILIAVGWFIGWPTLLTTAILPVLVYFYYKAAKREEEEVMEEMGDSAAYQEYRESTPMFV
ncbi:MAG: methyltransferase [Halobacteria archaeon]|nr:methyltransferase [Halobacteria archaeon]